MKQKSTQKVAKYEALRSVILIVQRRETSVISPNHCPYPLIQKCSGRQIDKKTYQAHTLGQRLAHLGKKELEPAFGSRWWSRRTCTHLLLQEHQNHSQLLSNHQLENSGTHFKKIPYVQRQRSHNKMVGGAQT